MKIFSFSFFVFLLFLVIPVANGQTRNKLNKRTSKRQIRKQQERASKESDYNKFNKLIPMGSRTSTARNDFIWSYETANTVSAYGGDISLINPSRFSIRPGFEIGTSIAGLPFVPMVYVKKRWVDEKWMFSTRHQIYSAYPILKSFNHHDNYTAIPEGYEVPQVLALKNELILSKAFLKELKCGGVKQPFLVLTAGLAFDYGFALKDVETVPYDYKFLNPREGVVLGNSGFLQFRVQGDAYLNKNFYLTVAARTLIPMDTDYSFAVEQNSSLRIMLSPKFSTSIGYWLNFGKGEGTFILPMLDLTFHFGQKETREKGLFKKF